MPQSKKTRRTTVELHNLWEAGKRKTFWRYGYQIEQITPFRYVEPVPLKYFIQKEAKINKVIDIKGLTDCLNEHRSVLLYYRAGMTDQTG